VPGIEDNWSKLEQVRRPKDSFQDETETVGKETSRKLS
jgi:hypothetical protein